MGEGPELPNLPGYASIKEAARLLGLADRTVYEYVEEGRLPAVRAADVIMVALEDVYSFKRGISGRPRKNTPLWRISSGDNAQFMLLIQAAVRHGQHGALAQKLEAIRKEKHHIFPGTVVRTIMQSDSNTEQVTMVLIWREAMMPGVKEREEALEAFRQDLSDVVDWSTARYDSGTVLIHT